MQEISGRTLLAFLTCLLAGALFIFYNSSSAETTGTINASAKVSVCGNGQKEGGEHCDGSDLGGKSCSHLNFSSGTPLCSAACAFVSDSCSSNAEVVGNTQFNSSNGGVYSFSNGDNAIEITLPENFYTDDLQFYGFSYANDYFSSSKPAVSGKNFVGKTYDIVFIDSDGSQVATISKQATFVLTYTDSDIDGIDESSLAPYKWGGSDSSWQIIPGATVAAAANEVTFAAVDFSSFVIFGDPLSSAYCGDSSCNGSETCVSCSSDCGVCSIGGGGVPNASSNFKISEEIRGEILKTADFNQDKAVNMADLSILLFYYGKTGGSISRYDLNESRKVDFPDVSILIYYWTVT